MKTIAKELMEKYSTKEIAELVKLLTPKKAKAVKAIDTYKADITNVFATIADNKIRPVLSKCKVTADAIIGTDLECTVIVKNNHNVPQGMYTKQMMELKTYQDMYKDSFDDFPIIKTTKQGTLTTYDKSELEEALNRVMFCASKSQDNLSVNCVRFCKDFVAGTDTYRLITVQLNSNTEFSLPFCSAMVLQKILKTSNAEIIELYDDSNRLEFYVGDTIMISKKNDLAYPNIKDIYTRFLYSSKITIPMSSTELSAVMKKLYTVSKDNSDGKNGFIINFKKKILSAVGVDKIEIEIPFDYVGEVDFEKIRLNAKFFEEYLKTVDLSAVVMELGGNKSAVKVNEEYIMMPLVLRD